MSLEPMVPSVAALSARIEELERVLKTLSAGAADTDKLAAELASADGIIVALKSALVSARDRETRMRALLRSASDYAVIETDFDGCITFWNSGAESLLGWTAAETLGQNVEMVFTPEDRDAGAPLRERRKALENGRSDSERWHLRKDDSRFWGSGLVLPLKADGTRGLLKIMRDETERHHADQTKKLLIAELNHRVKNTLAIVQAIASETLKSCAAEIEIRDALDSRLAALSQSHDILARENWRDASLTEVIKRALAPFVSHETVENRVLMNGSDIRLSPTCALSLGMAFHELATNAAKYGALSVPGGTVEIQWAREPSENAEHVRLSWHEKNGPPVSLPQRKGFGSRLIEQALPYQLNGTARLEYAPDGLRLKMFFPWADMENEKNDER